MKGLMLSLITVALLFSTACSTTSLNGSSSSGGFVVVKQGISF